MLNERGIVAFAAAKRGLLIYLNVATRQGRIGTLYLDGMLLAGWTRNARELFALG